MSNIINKVLEKTIGFNLKRATIRKVDKVKTKPIYVEFVGVPGVGKTTLFEYVFKEVKKSWRDIHELQRILIKYNDGKATESHLCYQKLADHKMKSLESRNFNGIDQMKLVKYFHSVLIADSLVHLFNSEYNIMSEEGIIHNFGEGIFELYKSNKVEFNNLMKQRAIVYCQTSAEIVAKRILEREERTGRLLPQHKVNSFDELVNLQMKSLTLKQQFVSFLSNQDIPVLTIDTTNSMTENVDEVKHFLKVLSEKDNRK